MLILMPVEVFSLFVTGGTILVQKFSVLFRKLILESVKRGCQTCFSFFI